MRWLPVGLVVMSNVAYHLGQKAVPRETPPLVAALAMYVVAAVTTLVLLPVLGPGKLAGAASAVHWSVVLVGVGIVGIEVGFLLAYRGGWPLSITAVTATTLLSIVLVPLGIAFFREALTVQRIAGLGLALSGLWLLARG